MLVFLFMFVCMYVCVCLSVYVGYLWETWQEVIDLAEKCGVMLLKERQAFEQELDKQVKVWCLSVSFCLCLPVCLFVCLWGLVIRYNWQEVVDLAEKCQVRLLKEICGAFKQELDKQVKVWCLSLFVYVCVCVCMCVYVSLCLCMGICVGL